MAEEEKCTRKMISIGIVIHMFLFVDGFFLASCSGKLWPTTLALGIVSIISVFVFFPTAFKVTSRGGTNEAELRANLRAYKIGRSIVCPIMFLLVLANIYNFTSQSASAPLAAWIMIALPLYEGLVWGLIFPIYWLIKHSCWQSCKDSCEQRKERARVRRA